MGIDQLELDRAETWSGASFVDEYRGRDPLLLTDLNRPSAMADESFALRCARRAEDEGSRVPAILVDVAWQATPGGIVLELPGGREAAKMRDAILGRLPFGRTLLIAGRRSAPLVFRPAEVPRMQATPEGLVLEGAFEHAPAQRVLTALQIAGGEATTLTLTS